MVDVVKLLSTAADLLFAKGDRDRKYRFDDALEANLTEMLDAAGKEGVPFDALLKASGVFDDKPEELRRVLIGLRAKRQVRDKVEYWVAQPKTAPRPGILRPAIGVVAVVGLIALGLSNAGLREMVANFWGDTDQVQPVKHGDYGVSIGAFRTSSLAKDQLKRAREKLDLHDGEFGVFRGPKDLSVVVIYPFVEKNVADFNVSRAKSEGFSDIHLIQMKDWENITAGFVDGS